LLEKNRPSKETTSFWDMDVKRALVNYDRSQTWVPNFGRLIRSIFQPADFIGIGRATTSATLIFFIIP